MGPLQANAQRRRACSWATGGAVLLFAVGLTKPLRAAEPCPDQAPWSHLDGAARGFLTPAPLTLTALAAVAPWGFAPSGLDHRLRLVGQRDLPGRPNLEPVSVATPYVLAGGLLIGYGVSVAAGSCGGQRAQAPVLQAMVLTFTAVALLKVGVGRRWPNGGTNPRSPDRLEHPERAREFSPFQYGVGAWPSGHTATMFAAAAAFRASNPELGLWRFAGYPLALGVASGMWLGDHHWGSDIVSGGLLGEAIGDAVGAGAETSALSVSRRPDGALLLTWSGLW